MLDNAFPLSTLTGIWHTEQYVSESRKRFANFNPSGF